MMQCIVMDDNNADQFRHCVTERAPEGPEADKMVQCHKINGGMN